MSLSEKFHEVIVLGAGPAGCTCALHLANRDVDVCLIDRAVFPRDKICGDALSGSVKFELRKLDLLDEFLRFNLKLDAWGIRFFAPDHQSLDVAFPLRYDQAAPGWICRRTDFDNFLVDRIREHPRIHLVEGMACREIASPNGSIEVRGSKTFRGRVIVGADGAQSVVGRQLAGMAVDLVHHSAGLRQYYKNVSGLSESNLIELHFYREVLPGYFWIFPLPDNYANVGIGMLSSAVSKKKVNLRARMSEIIQTHPNVAHRFADAKPVDGVHGFGLPMGSVKRKISGERFLLVGDAASLIDPFSGEGIGNAMTSGRLAALHLLECIEKDDFSKRQMAHYDKIIYEKLWPVLKVSYSMQKLVKYPWLFNLVVRKANKNRAVHDLILSMFDNTSLKKVLTRPGFYIDLFFK